MTLPNRPFVVVSGLPGSGKSTLANRVSEILALPVLDKDEILESLFESQGIGDAAWRRKLSRQSDILLRDQAKASQGAVLVSHWHRVGMPSDSGTPMDWLTELSNRIVHVRCICGVEIAASRFIQRARHPGHGDDERAYRDIVAGFAELEALRYPEIGPTVDVDTSGPIPLENVVQDLRRLLEMSPSK